jgi:DNA mismatch repair protein MutL
MADRPEIRELDPETVDRIAAGEVVERPASVVKELVENAIDADASRVEIAVDGDGTDRVVVRDDGHGMDRGALRRAVRQHTTSKVRDADDLERVTTLGFRGEALHTIGAVSRLTITSRPREPGGASGEAASAAGRGSGAGRSGEGSGTASQLTIEGGDVGTVEPAGRAAGTTVEVTDLFYNTPAREKYLGTETTEFGHVNTVATQYALANPDVAISLEHDGREVFATDGQGDLRSAVLSIYGRDVAEAMIDVDASVDGGGSTGDTPNADASAEMAPSEGDRAALPSGPLTRVHGLVSGPETTRSTRDYCSTFVNGRYVTDTDLRNAVLDAYGASIGPDRYPFAVLYLEVPPEATDVNVHPRKMEVRFDDAVGARTQVERAVAAALDTPSRVRSAATRGRSAPPETSLDAVDSEATRVDDAATTSTSGASPEPNGTAASTAGPPSAPAPADDADGTDGEVSGSDSSAATGEASADPATESAAGTGESSASPATRAAETGDGPEPGDGGTAVTAMGDDRSRATDDTTASAEAAGRDRHSRTGGRFDATAQTRFGGEPTLDTDRLPPLDVLGQVGDAYIVCESEDGLLVVDQHAADERVAYERLRDAAADGTSQSLVEPVTVELTAQEAAAFADAADDLARIGFDAERAGERTVRVAAVPAVIDETVDPDRIADAVAAAAGGTDADAPVRDAADALLADLACAPAVTAGVSLAEGSVRDLLTALDACDDPTTCPHGRPTVIRIDDDELATRFERDYPGHGRRPE